MKDKIEDVQTITQDLIPTLKELTKKIKTIENYEVNLLNATGGKYNKQIVLRELLKTSKINYKINQLLKYIDDKNELRKINNEIIEKRKDLQIMHLLNTNYLRDRNSKTLSLLASAIGETKETILETLKEEEKKLKAYDNKGEDMRDLEELDKLAYEYGYNLKDYDEYYKALTLFERMNTSNMRVLETQYYQGIRDKIDEHNELDRVGIFIQGEPNTGKTYTSEMTLREMGYKPFIVKGRNSGTFDKFRISNDALVIDDTKMRNLLNICDDYIVELYRRNNNNKIWKGEFVVITSNLSIEGYALESGIEDALEIEALKSRLIQFEIYKGELIIKENQHFRGTKEKQLRKMEKLREFITLFNKNLKGFKKSEDDIIWLDKEISEIRTLNKVWDTTAQPTLTEGVKTPDLGGLEQYEGIMDLDEIQF